MATRSGGAEQRYGTDGGGAPATGASNDGPDAAPDSATASLVRIGARRPPWRLAVGSVLRDWRTDQGLRLSDVAERARVSVQYLSEVERGRKEPSSEVLGAVTQALGGSLTDLALGVARHLAAADGRRRPATQAPARIAQVRELRAITTPQTVSRLAARDTVQADVLLLAA